MEIDGARYTSFTSTTYYTAQKLTSEVDTHEN